MTSTPYQPHFMVIPYTHGDGQTGYSKIVSISGRHHVVANIRGHRVPFYLSTGLAGKTKVEAGKWYPHFGIGEDGWVNKGPEEAMALHYNSSHLKKVADWLNTNVGNTSEGHLSLFGDDSSGVPVPNEHGLHIDAINQGLSPVSLSESASASSNAKDLITRVHNNPTMMSKPEAIRDTQLHILLGSHAKKHPELTLGDHLP